MDMELQVRALSSSWGPQRKSTAGHGLSLRHWVGIEMIWDERVWIMAFAGLLRFLSCSSQNTSSVHSLNQHSKPSVVTSCGYKNGWHIKLYEYDIQTGPLFTVLSFTGPQMEFHTVAIQREREREGGGHITVGNSSDGVVRCHACCGEVLRRNGQGTRESQKAAKCKDAGWMCSSETQALIFDWFHVADSGHSCWILEGEGRWNQLNDKGTSWFSCCYLNIQHILSIECFFPKPPQKSLKLVGASQLRRVCGVLWGVVRANRSFIGKSDLWRGAWKYTICCLQDVLTSFHLREETKKNHWIAYFIDNWNHEYDLKVTIFCFLIFMLNLWLLINYISGIFEWLRHSLLVFLFLHYGEKGILLTF